MCRTKPGLTAVLLLATGLFTLHSAAAGEGEPKARAPGNKAAQTDVEKLQGTWGIVTLEVEGAKIAEGALKGSKIIIQGKAFTTVSLGATYKGTWSVDASATPKTIDLSFTEGPEAGNKSLGIYELDGDTWKLCLTVTGKGRPGAFATKAGGGTACETLRREGAAVGRDTPPKKEAADGTEEEWTMVSGERDGQPLPEAMVKSGKRVVRGNETTVSFGGRVFLKAKITVDTTKNPHTMDYAIADGPNKGKTQYGIFEVDGDTIRLCFAPPGKDRPTRFATKEGEEHTLSRWKKTKR